MKYEVNFSNGAKTNFYIHETKGIFYSEILTGRNVPTITSETSSPSFINGFIIETKEIKEKSLDLVLKKTKEVIEELKDPSLTFTIKEIKE